MENIKLLIKDDNSFDNDLSLRETDIAGKLYSSCIYPEDYKGNNYILNKYFRFGDHKLDRLYIPEVTEEEFDFYKVKFNAIKDKKMNEVSNYYLKKIRNYRTELELGYLPNSINFSDYSSKEENFIFTHWCDQQVYEYHQEYKIFGDTYYDLRTLKEETITFDYNRCNPNVEILVKYNNFDMFIIKTHNYYYGTANLIDSIRNFIYMAIFNRKYLILQIDSLANNYLNYMQNTANLTENTNASNIENLYQSFMKCINYLHNSEIKQYISKNDDLTLFGNDEYKSIYIEAYQKVLRGLSSIRPNERLDFYKNWLLNPMIEDPYLEDILANEGIEIDELYDRYDDSNSILNNENIDIDYNE